VHFGRIFHKNELHAHSSMEPFEFVEAGKPDPSIPALWSRRLRSSWC
jgi:hypothetical protein